MTQHVNTATLVGQVLATWEVGNDRHVRLSIRRPTFYPYRTEGPNDLVTVVLLDAVARGQMVKKEDEIYVQGFIRNEDVNVTLGSLTRGNDEIPPDVAQIRIKTIVTTVVATQWQLVKK